jgi:hypothetical protein
VGGLRRNGEIEATFQAVVYYAFLMQSLKDYLSNKDETNENVMVADTIGMI